MGGGDEYVVSESLSLFLSVRGRTIWRDFIWEAKAVATRPSTGLEKGIMGHADVPPRRH